MQSVSETNSEWSPNRKSRREGVSLIVAIAVLAALGVLFLALSVDTGYLMSRQMELQEAVNAAAMNSAAGMLACDSPVPAIGEAPQAIIYRDIEIGFWDKDRQQFLKRPGNANAVRVTANVEDDRFLFAPVIGCRNARLQAQAIAMQNSRGGVSVVETCPLR